MSIWQGGHSYKSNEKQNLPKLRHSNTSCPKVKTIGLAFMHIIHIRQKMLNIIYHKHAGTCCATAAEKLMMVHTDTTGKKNGNARWWYPRNWLVVCKALEIYLWQMFGRSSSGSWCLENMNNINVTWVNWISCVVRKIGLITSLANNFNMKTPFQGDTETLLMLESIKFPN